MIVDAFALYIRSTNRGEEVLDIWIQPSQVDDENVTYQTRLPVESGFIDFKVKEGRATTDQIWIYDTYKEAVKAALKRIDDLIKSYYEDWKYTVDETGLKAALDLRKELSKEFPEYTL